MEFVLLLGVIAAVALLLHITRHVPLLALVITVGGSWLLFEVFNTLSFDRYEFFGATFRFETLDRYFLLWAWSLNLLLAVVALFNANTREHVSFLFWCWIPWVLALTVDSFPLAIFAWVAGLFVIALTLAPRRMGQVGGAAHYLLVVVLSLAGLLIANRFFELYPLTPEQTGLIATGVLFLAWALGLALAVVPFHIWLSALANETAPVYLAALTGWGLPMGAWFLFGLMRQYLWLTEKSNLLALLVFAGLATAIVGGLSAALERRANRVLAYASLLTFGFVLIDLGRARYDLLLNAGLALVGRGLALALFATGLELARATSRTWARTFALGAIIVGGAGITGFPLTPLFVTNLPIWIEYAVSDIRLFVLLLLAALGMWIGIARILSPLILEWRMTKDEGGRVKEEEGEAEDKETGRQGEENEGNEGNNGTDGTNGTEGTVVADAVQVEMRDSEKENSQAEENDKEQQKGEEETKGEEAKGGEENSKKEENEPDKIEAVIDSNADVETSVPSPDTRHLSPDDEYDPVQMMRGLFARVVSSVRGVAVRSPRVMHGLFYIGAHWQAFIGVVVVMFLMSALFFVGIFPTVILNALAGALGRPEYLR